MRRNVFFILFALILLCGKAWAQVCLPFSGNLSTGNKVVFTIENGTLKKEMSYTTNSNNEIVIGSTSYVDMPAGIIVFTVTRNSTDGSCTFRTSINGVPYYLSIIEETLPFGGGNVITGLGIQNLTNSPLKVKWDYVVNGNSVNLRSRYSFQDGEYHYMKWNSNTGYFALSTDNTLPDPILYSHYSNYTLCTTLAAVNNVNDGDNFLYQLDEDDMAYVLGQTEAGDRVYVETRFASPKSIELQFTSSTYPTMDEGYLLTGILAATKVDNYHATVNNTQLGMSNFQTTIASTRPEPVEVQGIGLGQIYNSCRLVKLVDACFQSESLDNNGQVAIKNSQGTDLGHVGNSFGALTGKTLPLSSSSCEIIGVIFPEQSLIAPIFVSDVMAPAATLPSATPGSLNQTTELFTPPFNVSISPSAGFTCTHQIDGGSVLPLTATTNVTLQTEDYHNITVTASREFYSDNAGTYNYDTRMVFKEGALYYRITNVANHIVKVICPNEESNSWDGYNEPTGSVVIPTTVTHAGVTYTVTEIGNYALQACTGITSLTLPNTLTKIGNFAFRNCSGITNSLVLPSNLTSIGNLAFSGCNQIPGALVIPSSVTTMGTNAFASCRGLTSVTVNSSTLASLAFYQCFAIETVNLSSNLTFIGNYAFGYCSALTSVLVPSSVTTLEDHAFYCCVSLVDVAVYASSIPDGVFQYCTGLQEVTIGPNVQSVHDNAFMNCAAIQTVHFNATNCTYMKLAASNNSVFNASASTLTTVTIGSSVTRIPDYAFSNLPNITRPTLPSTLQSIGSYAFAGCTAMTGTMALPQTLTNIGDYAFNNGPAITGHVNLPNIVSIGAGVFKGKAIIEVTMGANLTSIGTDAFANCSNLTHMHLLCTTPPACGSTIPTQVAVEVPRNAYQNYPGTAANGNQICQGYQIYSKLYDYEFHDDNTHYYGISTGNNKYTVVAPYYYGPTSIAEGRKGYAPDDNTLIYCPNLPSAQRPSGNIYFAGLSDGNSWGDVTAIDDHAFYDCRGITGIDFSLDPIVSIGERAFGQTYNIPASTIMEFPSSLQSIGVGAFSSPCRYHFTDATPINIGVNAFGMMGQSTSPIAIYVPHAYILAYKSAWTQYASIIYPWDEYDFCKLSGDDMLYFKITDDVNHEVKVVPPTHSNTPYESPYGQSKPSNDVTIPATVTYNSVTYTVTSIAADAFKGCSLGALTLGENIEHIAANAFNGTSWQANARIVFTSATCPTISAGYMLPNVAIQVPYDTYFTSYSSSTFTSHLTDADNQMYSVLFDLVLTAGNGLYVPAKQLTSNTARLTAPFYNFNQGYYYGFVGTNTYGLPSYDDIVPDFSYSGNLNLRFMLPDAIGQTQNSYIITEVGVDCFRGSSSLQSITFAGSLSSIADGAFSYCSNLHRITLLGETPPTLTSSLPTTIAICVPKTAFENYAWAANWEPKQLYSVNYDVMFDDPSDPNNHYYCVQNPGTSTYTIVPPYLYGRVAYEYKRLGYTPPTDAVAREYMPSASKPSGDLHLKGVNNAVGNITCIGATAFKGCNLTSVDFGEEPIQTIEIGAFESLNGISSDYIITIPVTVTSIGNSAFRYYTAKAHMLGTTPPAINEETFGYITSNPHFSVIYVPRESVDAYKTAWPQYESIIQPWECYDFSEVITSYRYFFSVTDAVNHKVELVAPNVTDNPYDGISDKPNWQIDIPATVTHDGVTYTITSIGEYALRGCSINQIYMGANIAYLANHALDGISTLRHVVFRTQNCPTVASSYVLPDLAYQVPRDRLYAGYYTTEWRSHFTDCDGEQYERLWNDYVIANNNTYKVPVQNINDRTAYKAVCPYFNITKGYYYTVTGGNPYHLPNFPTTDYSINYSGVLDLKNIPGNKKILEIGDDLLKGYTAVTGVVLADELTTIADGAFRNSGITEIELPHLVSSIGAGAFSQCQNLSIVKVWSEYTPTAGAGVFDGCTSLGTIYVGHYANVMDPYASKSGWSAYADKIEPLFCDFRIEGIYYGYVDIRNAQNPQTTPREMRVVSPHYNGSPSVALEYYADFEKTTGVVNVMDTVLFRGQRYPVKALNDRCFKSCSGITEVNLPSSVTGLGSTIFHGCTSLTHFEIPNTIEAIPTNTFEGSSVLTVVFPENFEVVTGFQGCHSLNNIVWPTMPARIEGYAFQGCQNLSSDFHVPYNVKRLGTGAFKSTNITNLDFLNDSIYEIGADAFQFCHNLTTAVLPKALVTLQEGCFYECENLQTVVLNEGLVTINSESGGETFRGCNNLHTLVIPSTVRNFNGNPFYRNVYIKDILCKIVDLDNLSISFPAFPADPNDRRIIVPRGMRQAYMDYTNANNYHPLSNLVWNANEQDWCAVEGEFDFVDTYEGNTLYYNVTDADNHTAEVSYIYHDAATRDQEESYYGRFDIIEPKGYVKIPDTVHPCHTNTAYAVTGIGANAFNMVQLAASIDLPLTITNIADGAFNNCGILQYLYARPFTPPTVSNGGAGVIVNQYGSYPWVHVQCGRLTTYYDAWSALQNRVTFVADDLGDYKIFDNNSGIGNHLWSNDANWPCNGMPDGSEAVVYIADNCTIDADVSAHTLLVDPNKVVTVASGGKLTVDDVVHTDYSQLVLEDGAQLITAKTGLKARVKKNVAPYRDGNLNDKWYFIGSPMATSTGLGTFTATISEQLYDLYRYDEPSSMWINVKDASNNFTNFSTGVGYLYSQGFSMSHRYFEGELNPTGVYPAAMTLTANNQHGMAGINLVGNPMPCIADLCYADGTAYAGDSYVMNEGRTDLLVQHGAITLGVADAVMMPQFYSNLVVRQHVGSRDVACNVSDNVEVQPMLSIDLISNDVVVDRAIVHVGDGQGLEKINLFDDGMELYLMADGSRCATTYVEGEATLTLCLKVREEGSYSLVPSLMGMEGKTLILVDTITGVSTDLNQSKYIFKASPADSVERFQVIVR